MIRVCVTGGRDYANRQKVFATLDALHDEQGVALIIHGGASGADSLANDWGDERGCWKEIYAVTPSEWQKLGKKAGPMRNGRMLKEGRPDLLVAFPGGTGTADCQKQAKAMGINIMQVW